MPGRPRIETIRCLAKRRRQLRLTLGVNQTIVDEEGFDHYRQLRSILAGMDVVFSSVIAYQASAMYSVERETVVGQDSGNYTAFGHLSAEGVRRMVAAGRGRRSRHAADGSPGAAVLSARHRQSIALPPPMPQPPCVALNSHLRLLPNGDVPTCQFNGRIVGNLRRQAFTDVWQSATATEQRAWVSRCAGCWAECETLPSGIYTGDLLRALGSNGKPPAS